MKRCDHVGRRNDEEYRCVLPAGHGFSPHQYGPLPRIRVKVADRESESGSPT